MAKMRNEAYEQMFGRSSGLTKNIPSQQGDSNG
jgi:hypothetical protein